MTFLMQTIYLKKTKYSTIKDYKNVRRPSHNWLTTWTFSTGQNHKDLTNLFRKMLTPSIIQCVFKPRQMRNVIRWIHFTLPALAHKHIPLFPPQHSNVQLSCFSAVLVTSTSQIDKPTHFDPSTLHCLLLSVFQAVEPDWGPAPSTFRYEVARLRTTHQQVWRSSSSIVWFGSVLGFERFKPAIEFAWRGELRSNSAWPRIKLFPLVVWLFYWLTTREEKSVLIFLVAWRCLSWRELEMVWFNLLFYSCMIYVYFTIYFYVFVDHRPCNQNWGVWWLAVSEKAHWKLTWC